METVAQDLMTLGAALVHEHPEGAQIIARALDYIDEQHKRIEAYKKVADAAWKKTLSSKKKQS